MSLPATFSEPAIRDPKKLRNTAWVLVFLIFIGGWLVLKAYEKWSQGQVVDERPAFIYRITPERDLRMLRQDGQIVNLVDLRGKVIVLNVMSNDTDPNGDTFNTTSNFTRSLGATANLVEDSVAGGIAQITLDFNPTSTAAIKDAIITWMTYGTQLRTATDFAMVASASGNDVGSFTTIRVASDYNNDVASWTAGGNISESRYTGAHVMAGEFWLDDRQ